MTAIRALLSGVVDYAGLYPPASLDLPRAVQNYLAYRSDPSAWMLGRFVVPVARLEGLASLMGEVAPRTTMVEVSATAGADPVADVAAARTFNNAHGDHVRVSAIEAKLSTVDAIERAAAAVPDCEVFAEVPIETDPAALVAAMARTGMSAKVRTGGVTPEVFPAAPNVVRFMRRCLDAGVRFKATAGLHHPVRAEFPLTYEEHAPRGTMFGYLNVLMTAGLLLGGADEAEAVRVLEEQDPGAFTISADAFTWRRRSLDANALRQLRSRMISFGSCSFREPVDELLALPSIA